MASILTPFAFLLWILLRKLYNAIRWISWKIKGIHSQEKAAKTVHIERILGRYTGRYTLDMLIDPRCLRNFITCHEGFGDYSYLYKQHVTLYCVDLKEAVFVETDPAIDVTHSNCGVFMKMEQYKRAKYIIRVPIESFFEIAECIGKPKGELIFLSNTGRCGSTLLTQICEATNICVAMSEPYAIDNLLNMAQKMDRELYDKYILSVVNVLCKPPKRQVKSYIIKLMAHQILLIHNIANVFPESKHVFMYRHSLPQIRSAYRLVNSITLGMFVVKCMVVFPSLFKKLMKRFKLSSEITDQIHLKSVSHFLAVYWAFTTHKYLKYRTSGYKIVAVRYEDIIDDKEYAVPHVLSYCGLPYSHDEVIDVLTRDSQRGTLLSMDSLSKIHLNLHKKNLVQEIRETCLLFGIPVHSEHNRYIVPGTITHRLG